MLKQVVCVLLIAVVGYWAFARVVLLGAFHQAYSHTPGECFHLHGIENGSEDIEVLPNGLAFISSGLNFLNNRKDVTGKIYLFDFNHPNVAPVELKIEGDERYRNINPHGFSVWTEPRTGDVYLYVINHLPEKEVVDKFRFGSAKKILQHVRRFEIEPSSHLLIDDLVVVGEDQFYYTNAVYWNMMVELALNLRWGEIGFYNGKNASSVASGLLFPNGIIASKDGKLIYVANMGQGDIVVYRRNKDNSLTFDQSIFLGSFLDNLDIDAETGDLWIGSHPSFFKLMNHVEDVRGYESPSQVFRIRFPGTDSSSSLPEIVEVYENDGTQLAASSVAVQYKKGLLIGTVFTRALYCQLDCY